MTTWTLALTVTMLLWAGEGAPAWHEQRYRGATRYTAHGDGADGTLIADASGRNSALLTPLAIDPSGVTLRWRWRALMHPAGADPEVRARDDRAAAVLVIVRRRFLPWRTEALLYQWTPARPRATWSVSPFSGNVHTLVVEDAPADSAWRTQSRDLEADLRHAFGEVAERIEAIGVITDADNTGARAIAEYGPITVARDGR